VNAFFYNQTFSNCEIPAIDKSQTIKLDLSFDRGETFSTGTQEIFVIPEPTMVRLNSTEYFFTFNEQVYIELEGTNLDKSGTVYVRVGDQV